MNPVRILLAEDHALVRAGIRSLLEHIDGVDVVAEAADGREAIAAVGKYRPHVVLMDIAMKGLNGIEATAHIKKDHPGVLVIMLSVHTAREYVLQALRAGASGYVLKDARPAELKEAIETVARGATYLAQAVSQHVISSYLRRFDPDADPLDPLDALTRRQREVLQLVAEGNTTRQIADVLHISVKTVETHRRQIMDALDIHDVTGLVRFALRKGLISPEQ